MKSRNGVLAAVSSMLVRSVHAYHWPSPKFDAVEAMLYERVPEPPSGASLVEILGNCQPTADIGRSTAAEWLRFAYHDMSTHNIEDGTGGLDASLYFELDRPENVGNGMRVTFFDFVDRPGKYLSRADIIAIGTVIAVSECGGPVIPLRYGRVDALEAGPPGVPEPEQDLETHIEKFRKQGFNQSEMIGLVACGHTMGGVRFPDFPDIVADGNADSDSPILTETLELFDTTPQFDNIIVTEYLNNTTKDPLVVNPNKTVVSDFRIFNSDGNATMHSLATPEAFAKTCQNLLERMINTVPRSVVLSDIVKPLAVKVDAVQLSPQNNNLNLHAVLRLATANPRRKVTMFWKNRTGGPCSRSACSAPFHNTTDQTTTLFRHHGMNPVKYYFDAAVNYNTSVSNFWFEVDEKDGSPVSIHNNGGTGYEIEQDFVLFDPSKSFIGSDASFNIVAAIKAGSSPSRVYANMQFRQTSIRDVTVDLSPDSTFTPSAGYVFYSTNIPRTDFFAFTFDLFSSVNGTTYTDDGKSTMFFEN